MLVIPFQLFLGAYWIYHKREVDVSQVYQNPEEKLWVVVKHLTTKDQQKGHRLEKNDIIKLGRIRLRVRDIDYVEKQTPALEQQKIFSIYNPNVMSITQRKITQDEIHANSVDINEIELRDLGKGSEMQFELSGGFDTNMIQKKETQKKHAKSNRGETI